MGLNSRCSTDEKLYHAVGRFSPDGKRVLYALVTPSTEEKEEPNRELAILDIATSKTTVVVDTPTYCDFVSYCWSPDGQRIAYRAADSWRETRDQSRQGDGVVSHGLRHGRQEREYHCHRKGSKPLDHHHRPGGLAMIGIPSRRLP